MIDSFDVWKWTVVLFIACPRPTPTMCSLSIIVHQHITAPPEFRWCLSSLFVCLFPDVSTENSIERAFLIAVSCAHEGRDARSMLRAFFKRKIGEPYLVSSIGFSSFQSTFVLVGQMYQILGWLASMLSQEFQWAGIARERRLNCPCSIHRMIFLDAVRLRAAASRLTQWLPCRETPVDGCPNRFHWNYP